MTPKEKAKDLLDKFSIKATVIYSENSIPCVAHDKLGFKSSRQLALIAVRELIKEEEMFQNGELNPTKFWKEVKEEINNL